MRIHELAILPLFALMYAGVLHVVFASEPAIGIARPDSKSLDRITRCPHMRYKGLIWRALGRWIVMNGRDRRFADVPGMFLADDTIRVDKLVRRYKWADYVNRTAFVGLGRSCRLFLLRDKRWFVHNTGAVIAACVFYGDGNMKRWPPSLSVRCVGYIEKVFVPSVWLVFTGHLHHDIWAGICLMREYVADFSFVVPRRKYEWAFSLAEMAKLMFSAEQLIVLQPGEVIFAREIYAIGDGGLCGDTPFPIDALRRFVGGRFRLWRESATRLIVMERQRTLGRRIVGNLGEVRDSLARAFPAWTVQLLTAQFPSKSFTLEQQIREAASFKLFCSAEGSNCIPLLYMAERGCFMEIEYNIMGLIWTRLCAWVGHFHVMLRIREMSHASGGVFVLNVTQVERAIPAVRAFLRT